MTGLPHATLESFDLYVTLMDMIMALEDRFDVSLPINMIAEIRTVDQLADTILTLCGRA